MSVETIPTLAEFLMQPDSVIAGIAPETMIYAVGGTRRSAALAGVGLDDGYARWSERRFRATSALCFRHGVHHLIAPVGRPQIFAETGVYRREFCRWVRMTMTDPDALDYYRQANWRVRLIVAGDPIPELSETAAILDRATRTATGPRLWLLTTADYDELWRWTLSAGATTRSTLVRRLFGEHVPPATLLVSFGKPLVALDHLPPFLFEEVQCYWTQRPGYSLTEEELRVILYDRVYLRTTWRRDKTGREQQALAYRDAFEDAPVIGLGRKMGPFWYPLEPHAARPARLAAAGLLRRVAALRGLASARTTAHVVAEEREQHHALGGGG